jgi:aspartyl-tRNA(Asn)/glutamyl-tRNA(Gln) amidotransferase subunit A
VSVPQTALQIAHAVRTGAQSASGTVQQALARIDAENPAINALTQVFHAEALARAERIDAQVALGQDPGPLAGVPVAIKDNICTTLGMTTCASRMLAGYRSPFDATAVEKLLAAGAVIIAKANLDEFAMGSSTENSIHGPTRNPHDHTRVPGGSSGGSAAAVAAGLVPVALGSDTGGSIRQPASHCGVVGLKPTYGRVSRYGLVAYASSLDQVGPLTRTVADAGLVASVIAGHDRRDSTCAPTTADDITATLSTLDNVPKGLVVGVPRQARGQGNSPGVAQALARTAEAFAAAGARVVEIDLPHAGAAIAAYYLIATAEASSNLARFDGIRYGHRATLAPGEGLGALYCKSRSEGFSPEVQRRIMLGTYALSSGYYDAYYGTALKVRRLIKQDYDQAFANGAHVVVMPAAPGPAFEIGSKTADPLAMYLEDIYTVGVNLAGLPAISVPVATETIRGKALPIGMQLIAPPLGEGVLLRAAALLERTGA